MKIYITRHCLSCNNINAGSYILGQYKDFEPHLSNQGIMDCLNFERFKKEPYKNVNTIYVSPLIRTWETAIILYQKPQNKEPLTLIIAPYLKEHTKKKFIIEIQRGNYPISIKENIKQFIIFLNTMKELVKNKNIKANLPNNIIIKIPKNKNEINNLENWHEIIINNTNQEYKLEETKTKTERTIPSSILKSKKEYYLENGDINKFIKWIKINKIKTNIHVVSHSKVMKAFSYEKKINIDKVKTNNAWTLIIDENKSNILYKSGIDTNIKKAKKNEESNKGLSICGKYKGRKYKINKRVSRKRVSRKRILNKKNIKTKKRTKSIKRTKRK